MIQKSELFVQNLIDTLGDYSSIIGIETQEPALGMVLGVTYRDYPKPGLTTGITYGLSAASHPEWKGYRPELCLTVESVEDDWVSAVARLVEWNRSHHSFMPGSLFHYGKVIASDTLMDSFLIFNDTIGEEVPMAPTFAQPIQIVDETIRIFQVYPLYHDEVEMIRKVGIRKFTGLREYSPYQVQRPDLSKIYQLG
jgi:hypothetical protein